MSKAVKELNKEKGQNKASGIPLNFSKSKPLENISEKYAWFDLRGVKDGTRKKTLLSALDHMNFQGIMLNEDQLEQVPKRMKKIKLVEQQPNDTEIKELCEKYDVLILKKEWILTDWYKENHSKFTKTIGTYVHVVDPKTLQFAVEMTHHVSLLIVEFKDDTKIPLEIVLADAQNFGTEVVMKVKDNEEAKVVFGVLECGANGVLFETVDLNQLYRFHEVVQETMQQLQQPLMELVITETRHVGMGDRACVDLTSYLGLDEGILLGSFSSGGILACSETHPLPYMPTRPFRVNAGALQTYVLAPDNRTFYLSDLRSGMSVLAVSTTGKARSVTVGRVKIERRPMLYIEAEAPDGTKVNVIMQEDWHVRVFGVHGEPINITTLKPGDKVLGYTMPPGRHVGVKVDELIIEQ